MPALWHDTVLAICVSDIHLSLRPPRARIGEADWLEAMARPLQELSNLAKKYDVPIVCAGDVFDYWRAEPELINFALGYLPPMFAIPGQHDLPLHNLELIKKSAFWTMVMAERITPLLPNRPVLLENMTLYGFPWGVPIEPLKNGSSKINVAVCHKYLWEGANCFPGAPQEAEISALEDNVDGFHALIFGDNHKGFLSEVDNIPVLNCGGFMRRNIDEEHYVPSVGLLCQSGKFILHRLNTTRDKFSPRKEDEYLPNNIQRQENIQLLIDGLSGLQQHSLDLLEALEEVMVIRHTSKEVRSIIMQAMEGK